MCGVALVATDGGVRRVALRERVDRMDDRFYMIRLTVMVSSAASGSGCSLFIYVHWLGGAY